MSGNVDIDSMFKEVIRSMGIKSHEMINFDVIDTKIKHRDWTGGTVVVDSDELEPDPNHLIRYKGRNVLLYIRDQFQPYMTVDAAKNYISDYRIHVTWCSTLMTKYNDGTFKKYVVSTEPNRLRQVNVICQYNQVVETMQDLKVCRNCLNILNYHGFKYAQKLHKDIIHNEFSFEDFFDEYGENESDMKEVPTYTPDPVPLSDREPQQNKGIETVEIIEKDFWDERLEELTGTQQFLAKDDFSKNVSTKDTELSKQTNSTSNGSSENHINNSRITEDELLDYLVSNGIEFFDKRPKGGALWIVGGIELKSVLDTCLDLKFSYSPTGGRVTSKRAAWWGK